MNIVLGAALVSISTFLLTVFAIAWTLAPPKSFDSRDALILAIGVSGVALACLAFRELRAISGRLGHASA